MQDVPNTEATRNFFAGWAEYQGLVDELDSYQYTRAALANTIQGRVLDIGNGGVFNYDLGNASEVVALDLVDFSYLSPSLPSHVSFETGDATSLSFNERRFDRVIVQMLIHHLAESSYEETSKRVDTLIREALRVLDSEGKFVIIESVLPKPFELMQKWLFRFQCKFLQRIGHPLVFQWSRDSILRKLEEAGFYKIEFEPIPQGNWMILLGRKWPTCLCPLQNYKIIATKW